MTSPLAVLLVSPVAAITEVEEDIDGGAPWGCYWYLR
jgi:hypothetical protein